MEIIVYIIIILAILGALISIHEAGHLIAAKAFNVYCFEYSLGFGPKLFKVRRKGGETAFSLRALPVGGFVSMYGEEGAVPEGEVEPDISRSLNSVAKWKKCIILIAGVTMNFILGLALIFVSDAAFPSYYVGYGGSVTTSLNETHEVDMVPMSYEGTLANLDAESKNEDYYLAVSMATVNNIGYRVLDSEVTIFNPDGTRYSSSDYVAVYYPSTLTADHDLGSSIKVFPVYEELEEKVSVSMKECGVNHFPDTRLDNLGKDKNFLFSEGMYIDVDLRFVNPKLGESYSEAYFNHMATATVRYTSVNGSLTGEGPTILCLKQFNTFEQAMSKWAKDVPTACGAVVQGFISLFEPGGLNNVSGVVGMTAALPQINALGGAGYIFYFAGLLSINLAFFNLLPFPGLDGWQLVVTVFEGITKKKMPQNVQGIVTIIGFLLLAGLMIAVTAKDIISLF